ncbi:MAG TPA: trypsin-like peptidase domain-containing protein [Thermoleophilia bacterium]|nr:trypsin-like peptidase domain-containing protein [Thermoleophilia bacterium]
MRLRAHTTVFLFGVAVTILALVALMAAGVVPVKTTQTTVVEKAGATTTSGTTRVASVTGGGLSPAEIYQRYSQGVVEIIATFSGSSGQQQFFGPAGPQKALGSGFVVSNDGYILTNAHVVSENGQTVKTVQVVFKGTGMETKTVSGTVVGSDDTSDVALIKVDPAKVGTLDPIPLGDSDAVQPGEPVVAIGNPLGYDFSITSGIVSATRRNLDSPNGSTISNGIQTDAAINEGNSGGPLIDSTGKVIGINEQIASQSGGNQGLGFAVPVNTAVKVMDQLKTKGSVTYAWLGISGQTVTSDVAKALGLKVEKGVLVARVVPGSPAEKAGIKGGSSEQALQGQPYVTGGDLITGIDGTTITSMEQLSGIINGHKPGETVKVTIVRDSGTKTLTVKLGERPASL